MQPENIYQFGADYFANKYNPSESILASEEPLQEIVTSVDDRRSVKDKLLSLAASIRWLKRFLAANPSIEEEGMTTTGN